MDPVTFDWSIITRQVVYDCLFHAVTSLGNKNIDVKLVQKTLGHCLKTIMPIRVSNRRSKKVCANEIYVGGYYYYELDKEGKKAIEIRFDYCPTQFVIDIPNKQWHSLRLLTADVVLHEILHLKQSRQRKFSITKCYVSKELDLKKRGQQEYLGDIDEIDAYAFNIACELWDLYSGNLAKSLQWLDSNEWQLHPLGQMYIYMMAFNGDHDHPVIKKLKRYVRKYITNCRINKSFYIKKSLTL